MLHGVDFYGNINHRRSYFKHIFNAQQEPEIVMEDWVRRFCEIWLKEEFILQRGGDYYDRGTDDHANGYYCRRLLTARGRFNLKVPRGRNKKYSYTLFKNYKRHSQKFEDAVVESLLLGHSSRDAKRFFDGLLGQGTISHALASKALRRFDHEIDAWKNKPIDKRAVVLVIDAVHLKGAITGHKRARPVLCAYCVYADGSEELVDFEPEKYESNNAYSRFCARLYNRGLTDVKLAVCDECDGIKEAVATFWPKAILQGCIFHAMQNFTKKLKGLDKKSRHDIIDDAEKIYEAKSKTAFYGKIQWFKAKYVKYKHHPSFRYLCSRVEETSRFYEIEDKYWPAAKTTNRLERTFKEVKRRVKAFGRFPNTRSCQRWLYALIKNRLLPQYRGIKSTHSS